MLEVCNVIVAENTLGLGTYNLKVKRVDNNVLLHLLIVYLKLSLYKNYYNLITFKMIVVKVLIEIGMLYFTLFDRH